MSAQAVHLARNKQTYGNSQRPDPAPLPRHFRVGYCRPRKAVGSQVQAEVLLPNNISRTIDAEISAGEQGIDALLHVSLGLLHLLRRSEHALRHFILDHSAVPEPERRKQQRRVAEAQVLANRQENGDH